MEASTEGGPSTTLPIFGGVTAAAPVSTTKLLATWNLGSDPIDLNDQVAYLIYVAPDGTPLDYTAPAARALQGSTSTVISGLTPDTTYTVAVRAIDEDGEIDLNTVTKTAKTQTDATAPTFAGLTKAVAGGSGAVTLSWSKAHDDLTPDAAISYLVFASDTPGNEDFTRPTLVTSVGATEASVGGLAGSKTARFFVVRARDAAGNVDTNTVEQSAAPGADVNAPTFGGCGAALTVSSLAIAVSWTPAIDDVSKAANLTYDIFASTTSGKYDFSSPFATVKGTDEAVIPALTPSSRYYFVCRAKDEAGNEDANTREVTATTGKNGVPPTFTGIKTFAGDSAARSAVITWDPATDDTTPQANIVYDVYVATAAGGEKFNQPPIATSSAGATTITVSGLQSNATLYFVVRARDEDGNRDSNTVEKSFTTNVSFAADVQPIFAHDCGVVGCHVPGSPTGGLILAPGFAYNSIVNVPALELNGFVPDGGTAFNYITPGDPADSFLNIKVNAPLLSAFKTQYPSVAGRVGTQMPAPSTGSTLSPDELAAIGNWIAQGAPNN